MKRSLSLVALALASVSLNGCASWFGKTSWFPEDDEYLKSRMEKPLQLPADIKGVVKDDEFAIPGTVSEQPTALGEALPPKLVLSVGRDVLVDSAAGQPVLTFNMSPATLLERVQRFLKETDVPNQTAAPGIIQTDWIDNRDEVGFWSSTFGSDTGAERSKYQLAVTPDGESGKGSLTVTQTAREVDSGDGFASQTPAFDGGTTLLNRFLGWYDEQEQRAARSRVLAEKAGFALSLATNSSDVPAFVAQAPFQRVWERIPQVLEPLGFVIDDKDQSNGTYFVQYDGAPSGGFWSFGGSDVEELDLDHDDYQLKLEESGQTTAITVLDEDGKPLARERLARIERALSRAFEARASDLAPRKKDD